MTHWLRSAAIAWLAAAGIVAAAPAAFAQSTSIDAARDLYAAASYDDALTVLDRLRASSDADDIGRIEYYRALCFLAVGRTADADAAMTAAVDAEPFARPSETDASPRVRTAFREIRRRMLPAIVERKYAEAKLAFDRKDESAADRFTQVVALIDDPEFQDLALPGFAQMRALATDYRVLSVERRQPR